MNREQVSCSLPRTNFHCRAEGMPPAGELPIIKIAKSQYACGEEEPSRKIHAVCGDTSAYCVDRILNCVLDRVLLCVPGRVLYCGSFPCRQMAGAPTDDRRRRRGRRAVCSSRPDFASTVLISVIRSGIAYSLLFLRKTGQLQRNRSRRSR